MLFVGERGNAGDDKKDQDIEDVHFPHSLTEAEGKPDQSNDKRHDPGQYALPDDDPESPAAAELALDRGHRGDARGVDQAEDQHGDG